MSETSTRAAKKLETLSRAVNRRKGALQKLRGGRPSAVGERQLRKLVKQAQRRKRKLEKDLDRHAVKKPSAPSEASAEAPAAETTPEA